MNWLVDIGLFALVGICSYFGIEHHLDSKANKWVIGQNVCPAV